MINARLVGNYYWYKKKNEMKRLIIDLEKIGFKSNIDHLTTQFKTFYGSIFFFDDANHGFFVDFKAKEFHYEYAYDVYETKEDYLNNLISTHTETAVLTEVLKDIINEHLKGYKLRKVKYSYYSYYHK